MHSQCILQYTDTVINQNKKKIKKIKINQKNKINTEKK